MSNHDEEHGLGPEIRFHLIRRMERLKVVALHGPVLLEHEARYLEFHRIAGVILFERNVTSMMQMADLVGAVSERLDDDGRAPLVMADHEGDFVSELKRIIGVPPAPLAIAAGGDERLAHDVALETGQAMAKLGVNTVLAPVADCYFDAASAITGLRTFGADPERVAGYVAATIAGFREAGVLACAKHFPGHGSTPEDSHETLPEVRKTLAELYAADLVPFRRAVDDGVDMIMMSHVAFPMGGDDLVPASFDGKVIRKLLREEMGYDGVVITDALEMAGARWYTRGRYGGFAGGSEHALLAGSDLLLHARPIPEQVIIEGEAEPVMSVDVIETIVKTLERVVDRSRIDEKLEEAAKENEALANILGLLREATARVERLRARIEPPAPAARPAGGKVVAFDSYPSVPHIYRTVAEQSIIAVSDWDDFSPLEAGQRTVVVPIAWHAGSSLHGQDIDGFVDVLCKRNPGWRSTPVVYEFETTPDGGVRAVIETGEGGVVDAARFSRFSRFDDAAQTGAIEVGPDEELVIVLSSRGVPAEEFMAALQTFAEDTSPSAVVLTGWLVTDWIPESAPVLWSLGASTPVAAVVARILSGDAEPAGRIDGLVPG